MSRLYTQIINGTDCIGDSRTTINNSFELLDDVVQALSSQDVINLITNTTLITGLSTQVQTIDTEITTLSTDVIILNNSITNLQTSFDTSNIGPSATLTTYVSALSVFTPAGSYIGFIPIYQ